MTVLEKKDARGVDVRGFASYLAVGVISVAIGVGFGLGIGEVAEQAYGTPAQQAMAERGAAVGTNLDSIWRTGLAQQQAIEQAALLETRIQTGLVQKAAIASAHAPRRALEMRGAATADHLESLFHAGAVTQDLYSR